MEAGGYGVLNAKKDPLRNYLLKELYIGNSHQVYDPERIYEYLKEKVDYLLSYVEDKNKPRVLEIMRDLVEFQKGYGLLRGYILLSNFLKVTLEAIKGEL